MPLPAARIRTHVPKIRAPNMVVLPSSRTQIVPPRPRLHVLEFVWVYDRLFISGPLFNASLQLPDGSADQEFGGQHSAAKSHLRVMQALEEHLHTGFADLLFVNANGGKRRIHQDSFFTIVETYQADLVRHLHATAGQRAPKPKGDFVVARYDRRGTRFLRQNSPDALLTEIAESEGTGGGHQNRFQFVLAHCLPVAFVSPT